MANKNELRVLPSKVIVSEENIAELDALPETERTEIEKRICQNISRQMESYYSSRPKEWKAFVKAMS